MRLHQPRLADLVASELRERIAAGSLSSGSELPRQEVLMEEFGVGKPAMREALRILEAEGLLRVRRGNQGGATVHAPETRNAAYAVGLVLQSRRVALSDLREAIRAVEPMCVALCAAREDRREAVLPALRRAHADVLASATDDVGFTDTTRKFHELMVNSCGNQTLILIAGALESLWSSQELAWARDASDSGRFPDAVERHQGIAAHQRLIDLIEAGEVDRAQQQARKHLSASLTHAVEPHSDRVIDPGSTNARRFR